MIGYVKYMHLDVISAKTGLSKCGPDTVFALKNKATLEQTKCKYLFR